MTAHIRSLVMRRRTAAVVAAMLFVISSPVMTSSPYRVIDVGEKGTIAGRVRLNGTVPKLPAFEVPKDNDWCGTRKISPRLVVGPQGGVGNAVISLQGITQGKAFSGRKSYVLDQRKCEYVPHVLILPLGSNLDIVNSDAVLHNVHAYAPGKEPRTVFNIAQPVTGVRFPVKADRLAMPGIYSATCDAGHPWMSAFVVVAEHPYYTVTGDDGRFELKDIPPGTYTLKLWREGVAVTKIQRRNAEITAYIYEEPYEMEQTVTVASGKTTNIDFELSLRPAVYGFK